MMHVLSLGAGVQSSTLALMFAAGEVGPMPAAAIFSDTQAEPAGVYRWLDWLEQRLPFPVHRVTEREGLTKNIEQSVAGARFAGAPFFANTGNGAGPLRRQCTREFKIVPIVRQVRQLLGLPPRHGPRKRILAVQYIGISLDEAIRMKPSRVPWIEHRWPLVDRRMTRQDCKNWMERHGFPEPPRSACVYCPYKSNHEWRQLRDTDADGWAEAVRVDTLIRSGVRGTRDPLYVHRSLVPLASVDLTTAADHGQTDLFSNECEGMCGV
jgi:hypothetical protein